MLLKPVLKAASETLYSPVCNKRAQFLNLIFRTNSLGVSSVNAFTLRQNAEQLIFMRSVIKAISIFSCSRLFSIKEVNLVRKASSSLFNCGWVEDGVCKSLDSSVIVVGTFAINRLAKRFWISNKLLIRLLSSLALKGLVR